MERTRTTLLLLLVVGLTSMTALGAAAPSAAATGAQAPAIAAAGESPCSDCLKCPCGCSPLAGAWVAKLFCDSSSKSSAWEETVLQTFKFAPVNDGCTKFVVNSQAATRLGKVAKFWPDACDQTEFVGVACKDQWKDMKLTAVSYGVQRCITAPPKAGGVAATSTNDNGTTCPTTKDKVVFIAVMTAKIEIPESCLDCDETGKSNPDPKSSDKDGKQPTSDDKEYSGPCKEPKELKATIFIAYFDAAQDVDHDGFPDAKCDEAVLCVRCETCLKRVELTEPCEAENKSFTACLKACENVTTAATGRAFVAIDEEEQDVDVVLTVQNINNVTRAALQISGADVLVLFPVAPDKATNGAVEGLLVCREFTAKDFIGSLKNKKLEDLQKAIDDGKVTVVVSTGTPPKAEICGTLEDP